jgi:type VI secretion system protein ImpF
MAKIQAEQPLIPSVLDRLLDNEPEVSREAPHSRNQVLREVKLSLGRDLENLLNTRRRYGVIPAGLPELRRSLVRYGIPDFTGSNMGSMESRQDFCRTIAEVIRDNEPRLKTVHVKLLDNVEPLDRTLRFRIDALMRMDPAPEPVVFDSALEPGTGTFQVRGVNR